MLRGFVCLDSDVYFVTSSFVVLIFEDKRKNSAFVLSVVLIITYFAVSTTSAIMY